MDTNNVNSTAFQFSVGRRFKFHLYRLSLWYFLWLVHFMSDLHISNLISAVISMRSLSECCLCIRYAINLKPKPRGWTRIGSHWDLHQIYFAYSIVMWRIQRSLLECIVQVLKAIKISTYNMHFQAAKSIVCADFIKHLETLISSLSHW